MARSRPAQGNNSNRRVAKRTVAKQKVRVYLGHARNKVVRGFVRANRS